MMKNNVIQVDFGPKGKLKQRLKHVYKPVWRWAYWYLTIFAVIMLITYYVIFKT